MVVGVVWMNPEPSVVVQVFCKMLQKNLKELFGQSNTKMLYQLGRGLGYLRRKTHWQMQGHRHLGCGKINHKNNGIRRLWLSGIRVDNHTILKNKSQETSLEADKETLISCSWRDVKLRSRTRT